MHCLTACDKTDALPELYQLGFLARSSYDCSRQKRNSENTGKQECIPVWCVPPALYRTGCLCPKGVLPNRDPPGQRPHPVQRFPLDRDPRGLPRYQTWNPLNLLTSDIWWPSIENIFDLVHLRTYPRPPNWYWHLVSIKAHTVGKRELDAFLVYCGHWYEM